MIIDREKLKDIIPVVASQHRFRPAIVEKDYYLTIVLSNIEALLSGKIVFKGGTLLNKIHLNYHRLSEDLDFTYAGKEALRSRAQRSRAITPIRDRMAGFLQRLGLSSDKPGGEGFNDSTQYVFNAKYPSFVTNKDENIKIEVGLRQLPIEEPVYNVIRHFYKDPFTGEDLIPASKVLSLSYKEAVAEKLKAAITRKDPAIRDFYDLWHIAKAGFDFQDKGFIALFKAKLAGENHQGGYAGSFGLNTEKLAVLQRQVETELMPVIRTGERFDLAEVIARFDRILSHKAYG